MGRSLVAQGAASLRAEPWDQGGAVLSPVGATVCTAAPTGLCRRDTAFPGLAEAAAPWATNEQPYGLRRKVLLPHEVSGSIRLTISWSTYKRDMHPLQGERPDFLGGERAQENRDTETQRSRRKSMDSFFHVRFCRFIPKRSGAF